MVEKAQPIGDAVSLVSIAGALLGYLPAIASAFAIVWYGIFIYDRVALWWRSRREKTQ